PDDIGVHAFSPDGRSISWSTVEYPMESYVGLNLLNLATGKSRRLFAEPFWAAAFSPDGQQIAVQAASRLDQIVILDRSGRETTTFDVKGTLAGANAWSPDGRLLVTIEGAPHYGQ